MAGDINSLNLLVFVRVLSNEIRVILNTRVGCIIPTFDTVLYGESNITEFEGVGRSTTKSTL